jgi:hypothetical protein
MTAGKLFDEDLVGVLRRTPKVVFDLLKAHSSLFIAGGFIRACVANEEASDIDLFAPSKDYAKASAEGLANATNKELRETENAFTVYSRPCPVQFIHRWTFSAPEDAIRSFDFSIAQAAVWWDGEQWRSICSVRFYADLAARRLVYLCPERNEDAGGSIIRVLKFYQRGYRIPLDSMGAVISRLLAGVHGTGLKQDDFSLFVNDEKYRAKILTGLLREVDPNSDPIRYIIPASTEEVTPQ